MTHDAIQACPIVWMDAFEKGRVGGDYIVERQFVDSQLFFGTIEFVALDVPPGAVPLTLDELAEGAALLGCVRSGLLDRTPSPPRPLDILAQQVVAASVAAPSSTLFCASFARSVTHSRKALRSSDFGGVNAKKEC